jgi:hypothetical protein
MATLVVLGFDIKLAIGVTEFTIERSFRNLSLLGKKVSGILGSLSWSLSVAPYCIMSYFILLMFAGLLNIIIC